MKARRGQRLILTLLTWAVALVVFFPALLLFLTGFKTEAQAYNTPPSLVFTPTLDNFTHALADGGYVHFLTNSIVAVGVSTVLAFVVGLPSAFGLAFYPGRRARGVVFWILSTRFMPAVAVAVPIYILFTQAGLRDTLAGLVLVYAAMATPLVVLLMRAYYLDISREIIEAAQIDGASLVRLFADVVLPLSRTGIAATAILALIFSWNEFFFALVLTRTEAATLPVFLSTFQTSEGLFWAKMSAAASLAVWPTVLLGWLAQRNLTRGFTLGAVK